MNLKAFSKFIYILAAFSLFFVSSCKDDSTYSESPNSADAQIYTFRLNAKYTNSKDSLAFVALKNAKFVIDQSTRRIYNPDSLPMNIPLRNFELILGYSTDRDKPAPSVVNLVYQKTAGDSIVKWNGKDSVNFSKNNLKIEVVAFNGTTSRTYDVELRVHKIDVDTILWNQMPSLPLANSVLQKTVFYNNKYYCFALTSGNSISKAEFDPQALTWGSWATVSPSLSINSITVFNGSLYANNSLGHIFLSTDGSTWTDLGNQNVTNIIGVLPSDISANDVLLSEMKDSSGKNYFLKMSGSKIFTKVNAINGWASDTIVSEFPAFNFSSMTNYNRSDNNSNILLLTGGKDYKNNLLNTTWVIKNGKNGMEMSPMQYNYTFAGASDISTFLYDSKYYAFTNQRFYISSSWGFAWAVAPQKQSLPLGVATTIHQTMLSDSQNYIWIFGLNTNNNINVWRGRLNKLNPKL